MSIIEFNYKGIVTKMICNLYEKLEDICKRFSNKIDKNFKDLDFFMNEKQIRDESIFNQSINIILQNQKEISLLVYDKNSEINQRINKSKQVICPICKENSIIEIIDYKINFKECKNKHTIKNMLLNEFDKSQNIDESKIICDLCKQKNKENLYNKEFYICCFCKLNLCPFCKYKHNIVHNIINYEQKKYICYLHNEKYNSYCLDCKDNICIYCDNYHYHHNIISYRDLMPNKRSLLLEINKLKNKLNILYNNVYNIIFKLNKFLENIRLYYKIFNDIIKNFDTNKINYQILKNINDLNFNNIYVDIDNIILDDNIYNKFKYILEIYNKMNINQDINEKKNSIKNNEEKNKIKLIYKVNNKNKIKILGNYFVKNNIKLCNLIYKENEYNIAEYFIIPNNFINDNKLEIELTDINKLTNISEMFYECSSLISLINISKWNTIKITNMSYLFYGCSSLLTLPDISKWNTINVTDMSNMFSGCSSLKYLPDISKWNIKNTKNISNMFFNCSSLISLPDISKWNTINLVNISNIFYNCSSLMNLPDISKWQTSNFQKLNGIFSKCFLLTFLPDISKWNTTKAVSMKGLFEECTQLQSLPDISKWDTSNVKDMSYMFYNCYSLINLPNISKWNTRNLINISYMFYNCSSLILLPDISKWNNNNIIEMTKTFDLCKSLTYIPNITKFIKSNNKDQ